MKLRCGREDLCVLYGERSLSEGFGVRKFDV